MSKPTKRPISRGTLKSKSSMGYWKKKRKGLPITLPRTQATRFEPLVKGWIDSI